jgi:hypothetical protein
MAYAAIPRHADLTRFDPAEMARLATAMWRHSYANATCRCSSTYERSRREQGYSPLDSVRVAVAAARAAKAFQPSASRAEAEAASPYLVGYYRILARDAHGASTSEADRSAIEERLRLAYRLLEKAVSSPLRRP